jgi:hypothetical protein
MPKIPTKIKPTYTITLTHVEAEALRTFCLRARGAWNIKREVEGWEALFGALDKLDAALLPKLGEGTERPLKRGGP